MKRSIRKFSPDVMTLEGRVVCDASAKIILMYSGQLVPDSTLVAGIGTGPLPTAGSGPLGGILGPDNPIRITGPEIDLNGPDSSLPYVPPTSNGGGGGDWSIPDGDYTTPDTTIQIAMAGCTPINPTLTPTPFVQPLPITPPPTWEPGVGGGGDWGDPYVPITPFPGEGLPSLDPPLNPVGPVGPG